MTSATPPDLALDARDGLPDALRVLVAAYPRAGWQGHGNFGGMVRFWLERHAMFRDLTGRLASQKVSSRFRMPSCSMTFSVPAYFEPSLGVSKR